MPMMKLHRRYRLATTKGHAVQFEPDVPVYVPPAIVSDAVAIGAVPVDGEVDVTPQDPPKRNAGPADAADRERALIDVFARLVAANERRAFTAGGVPTAAAVEDLTGFEVSRREINDAWTKRAEYIANGTLDAEGKWVE
jgi:hypothetical protein